MLKADRLDKVHKESETVESCAMELIHKLPLSQPIDQRKIYVENEISDSWLLDKYQTYNEDIASAIKFVDVPIIQQIIAELNDPRKDDESDIVIRCDDVTKLFVQEVTNLS